MDVEYRTIDDEPDYDDGGPEPTELESLFARLTFKPFVENMKPVPGMVVNLKDGSFHLIGDVNELLGVCDDCRGFDQDEIVAYSLIWEAKPECFDIDASLEEENEPLEEFAVIIDDPLNRPLDEPMCSCELSQNSEGYTVRHNNELTGCQVHGIQ